jgi:xylose dehydrogenase (NAD/NADP)
MGGSVEELKTLLQQCKAANLQFMDGCMWYHSARTKAIDALLQSGELGPLRTVNAAFTFHYPDEAWLDGGNGRTDKKREPMG